MTVHGGNITGIAMNGVRKHSRWVNFLLVLDCDGLVSAGRERVYNENEQAHQNEAYSLKPNYGFLIRP